MAPFRFLRRLLSRRSGWGRNSEPEPASERFRRRFSEAELADPVEALLGWLHGGDIPDVAGAAEARVASLESRYGIRIPDDFRRYLLAAPSFETTDDEFTAWWALDRVTSLPDGLTEVSILPPKPSSNPDIAAEEDTYLLFADYMIWCWGWAVCCSDGPNRGRVAMIADRDGFVADSFDEFARRYLLDPGGMANMFPKD